MQTFLKSAAVRALLILLMGIGLIAYADIAPTMIVRALGLLFIIPGLVTTLSAFASKPSGAPMLPSVVGGGSIFFGVILLLLPGLFVGILMYLLAALIILVSGMQLLRLIQMLREGMSVNIFYFVFPIATLIAGIYILAYPNETASLPFVIMGYAATIYAVCELVLILKSYFYHRSLRKAERAMQAEAHPTPDVQESATDEAEVELLIQDDEPKNV
ncbi:MAG: DUF308 domain-containing protein [Bacteroidaceae bacterium]|nr:DUF308 domain-containing protein [Bacteroidaceae bacterium]